ncbi:hypothetical protein halTADL_2580 [Halohasta litchfieldiae]|jgi:hypothetical protein|uniref:Uncharacterized protein n=1 Tax=Halohasta litchfieldiae TaxID=1073996 RepID=A0A1H6RU14_9EURY|nr:hypothetical protein [Halohasta litchfieldiae]ATW89311.1 hypothetical protein halTADL_2580 [Halohasta litchfieldiae]SEI59243.1 hypothetical protein SAMN05444271_103102 [Halohasta litchfieldiae]
MQPTRRRCLAIAGVGIGAGVAGCLSSGSNITYPERTDGSDGQPDASGNGDESPGESEEPSGDPINSRIAEETASIYDELRWFETEYDRTMRTYRGRLRDVYTEVESLLETLTTDGRLDAQPLEDVEAFANDVASTVIEIPKPQFTGHINFSAVNDDRFPVAKQFRNRKDWDRVERELEYVARIYGEASTVKATEERYSPNPVDNRLHEWLAGDEPGTMFEIRHRSDDPDQHDDADQRLPGHGVYVVNDSSREIEYLDRPMGGRRYELLSSIDNRFEPFAESTDRRYQLYVRFHDVGTSGRIDPTQTDPLAVYGQQYADLAAAEAAFETVVASEAFDLEIESQVDWGDETWNQVLYTKDGQRFYAYFCRADSYLFAVDPSPTPWEERSDEWTELLSGTWLNP